MLCEWHARSRRMAISGRPSDDYGPPRRATLYLHTRRDLRRHGVALFALVVAFAACGPDSGSPTESATPADSVPPPPPPPPPPTPPDSVWDVDARGVPPLIEADYIDLSGVSTISRFRSSIGHDYSDAFEACRSMKHYFVPRDAATAATIGITAPVSGRVVRLLDEWAGTQIHLRPDSFPAFTVIMFHVRPSRPLAVGDAVHAGAAIGTHVGSQTFSDIAIAVNTPAGFRLVSWVHALADSVWMRYQARGLTSRDELVISRAQRDDDPLACDGQAFVDRGSIPDWITLR